MTAQSRRTIKNAARVAGLLLATAVQAAPVFDARECPAQAVQSGARCGVVYVPENHSRPRGRKIPLSVIVLPASGAVTDRKRAQYDLEGGPGFAATDFLEFYAGEGAPYRVSRDVVLADMRGTGKSNPLRCFGIEEREKRQPGLPMYPPDLVAECARQSSVASDPAQYSTAAAAQDIELVRQALGYEQLDLNAISYGTTLALRYMAEFPKRVHAAALMGTVPARDTPPRFHASAAEASLQMLAAECAADANCRTQFGDVNANLDTALRRVLAISTLTAPVFMESLRNLPYAPATRIRVPYLLAQAAGGNFRAFTQAGNERVFSDGLYLSITCGESFAQMDVAAAITAAGATRFGAYRLERQRDACAAWPKVPADPKLMREADSVVPVLFLAGALDPVSPPQWAREEAAHFANARVVTAPHGAHLFDGLSGLNSCLDASVIRFFDTGDARGLDASCFEQMLPPAFGASP